MSPIKIPIRKVPFHELTVGAKMARKKGSAICLQSLITGLTLNSH